MIGSFIFLISISWKILQADKAEFQPDLKMLSKIDFVLYCALLSEDAAYSGIEPLDYITSSTFKGFSDLQTYYIVIRQHSGLHPFN